MNDDEVDKLGRLMAGVLRHFPGRFGLKMDSHGWVSIADFVDTIRRARKEFHWLRNFHIKAIVETDSKGRYQIEMDKVRATYGHSIDVDLDLPTDDIPSSLYYPATSEECEILLETGLKPSDRKFVHLSKTKEDAVIAGSQRSEKPIILHVNAEEARKDGIIIKRAGKTVYLAEHIPPKFLSKVKDE
ncbi:MAG: RNA 2'-phosphotransferase [Candidatus Thermoplasmatota archaeon]